MEARQKHKYLEEIAELKAQVEIANKLREMVEKHKHFKQVNKRFTDAIKELEGYDAWIGEQYGSQYISVQRNRVRIEARKYNAKLTWDIILEQIPPYEAWLADKEAHLACLDDDIEKLKKILEVVKENPVSNFSTFSIVLELESAIKYSGTFEKVYKCNHWKCNAVHKSELEGTWCPACDNGHIREQYIKVATQV